MSPEGSVYVRIDNTAAGEHADWWATFAAQYDPFQFMTENTSPNLGRRGMNESWFAVETQRIRKMGLQGIRMWFQLDWWEPLNDNDDPNHFEPDYSGFAIDSPRMQAVCRFLDMCQQEGVEVGLNFGWKLGQPARHWIGSIDGTRPWAWIGDEEEHAESLLALVKYLCEVKKYTCITQLTLGNEHEYNYADLYPAMIRRLEQAGLRDRFVLWGIETNKSMERNLPYVGVVDAFTVHIYRRIDFEAETNKYYDMLGQHGARRGNVGRVWFSEFAFGGEEAYAKGLFVADALIGSARAGAYAIGGWRLGDQHLVDPIRRMHGKDKADHGLHQWGLWRWIPWMQRPRDVYYAAAILTRYVPRRSVVLRTDVQGELRSVCFRKGQDYTVVVLNRSAEPAGVAVEFAQPVDRPFRRHLYSRQTLPEGAYDTIIPADRTIEGSNLTDELPGESLAVYTTLPEAVQVELAPYVVRAEPGRAVRLEAAVLGAGAGPHELIWSVDGGDANGTVDATGLYTPPPGLPEIDPVIVRAQLKQPPGAAPAADGLAVVLFEGEPEDPPARASLVLVQDEHESSRFAGPRQFDLGQNLPVGTIVRRTIELTNAATRDAGYAVTSSVPWLAVTPEQGTLAPGAEATIVTVTIDTTGLRPGRWHIGHLSIDSPRALGRDVVDVYFRTAE